MIPSDVRLYTWIDFEDTLIRALEAEGFPEWFIDARTYYDEARIRTGAGRKADALAWLLRAFDPRIGVPEGDHIVDLEVILESVNGSPRILPIVLEETNDPRTTKPVYPSFARPAIVSPGLGDFARPEELSPDAPLVFAFHSFKGGVGRTVHAIALAQALADRKKPVLLVDADLEAPGITWLIETRLPSPPVSFSDFLALVHGDADPAGSESVELVANRLQDSLLNGIYVLPAFRTTRTMCTLDIRPEHLLRGSERPFRLLDLLSELGKKLGVAAVVVDLSAGLSELSSGILLDPRVSRILVTTLSGQSLVGTQLVLSLIGKRAPSIGEFHPVPIVITNQVPADLAGSEHLARIEERLFESISETVRDQELQVADVLRGPSWFEQGLVALPAQWDEALAAVRKSQAFDTVSPLAQVVPELVAPSSDSLRVELDQGTARQQLASTAQRLVYAEQGEDHDFLPTGPLRKLTEDHRNQLPVAVVVGAKGAGKTYTYLQIVRRGDWKSFAKDTGTEIKISSIVFPFLQSKNLRSAALKLCSEARDHAVEGIQFGPSMSREDIGDHIRSALRDNLHEGEWRDLWLDMMAWAVGYHALVRGIGRRLPSQLARTGRRILMVVDGLEDEFQQVASNSSQQTALRSLLQDVPNWLEQQPDAVIGLLVFVRKDMVTQAVLQNSLQLLDRYSQYSLKWERTEALRLVVWLAEKAGVLPKLPLSRIQSMEDADLTGILTPLWGKKLGRDKSREARSADWVIAALSDFRGQIQARDLVRLVARAAELSTGAQTQWTDRILAPPAIRDAVKYCSTQKVDEISQENPSLKAILDRLRDVGEERKQVPFSREDVGLSVDELRLLELNGIVVPEKEKYYMAEIFRHSLGFRLPEGARPRVLVLSRRTKSVD